MRPAPPFRWLSLLNFTALMLDLSVATVVLVSANLRMQGAVYEPLPAVGARAPAYARAGSLPLTALLVCVQLASGAVHLADVALWPRAYARHVVVQARNPLRWLTFALAAPSMLVIMAYLAGLHDARSLGFVATLSASGIALGHLTEVVSRPEEGADRWARPLLVRLTPHVLGYPPLAAAWFGTLYAFYRASAAACRVPAYLQFVLLGEAALFSLFVVPQLYQIFSPPSRYYRGEMMYIVLGATARAFLSLVVLVEIMTYDSFDARLLEC